MAVACVGAGPWMKIRPIPKVWAIIFLSPKACVEEVTLLQCVIDGRPWRRAKIPTWEAAILHKLTMAESQKIATNILMSDEFQFSQDFVAPHFFGLRHTIFTCHTLLFGTKAISPHLAKPIRCKIWPSLQNNTFAPTFYKTPNWNYHERYPLSLDGLFCHRLRLWMSRPPTN